jgi:hypothetical protein
VTKRKLAVVQVESRSHHHVEWWGTRDKPQEQGTRATRAVYGKMKTYRQQEDIDILGRDPTGPLAPLGGPKALLHRPFHLGCYDILSGWSTYNETISCSASPYRMVQCSVQPAQMRWYNMPIGRSIWDHTILCLASPYLMRQHLVWPGHMGLHTISIGHPIWDATISFSAGPYGMVESIYSASPSRMVQHSFQLAHMIWYAICIGWFICDGTKPCLASPYKMV